MIYAAASERAQLLATQLRMPMFVCHHPVSREYTVASLWELNNRKDWTHNREGFPNVGHVVYTADPK